MSTFKKCKVVMLPTKEATRLFIKIQDLYGRHITSILRRLEYSTNETFIRNIHLITNGHAATNVQDRYTFHNLYIVSDEEIKDGDWVFDSVSLPQDAPLKRVDSVIDETHLTILGCTTRFLKESFKKIIATTDESLTWVRKSSDYRVMHLPEPSQSFIGKFVESYNKETQITDVLVEYREAKCCAAHPQQHYCVKPQCTCFAKPEYLKVDKDNAITIRKVKDSWNKEEVTQLLHDYREFCWKNGVTLAGLNTWIENKL